MIGEVFLKILIGEGIKKGFTLIGKQINPKLTYNITLADKITAIVQEYRTIDSLPGESGKIKFYEHAKTTDDKLAKYVFFNREEIELLLSDYNSNPEITPTTKEDIEHFTNFFITKIQDDAQLKELFIEENYKEKVLETYEAVKQIEKKIDDDAVFALKALLLKSYHDRVELILDALNKNNQASAIDLLKTIENQIQNDGELKDSIKAKIYFLRYRCLWEIGNATEGLTNIRIAQQCDQDNILYKEKLCKAEFEKGEKETAYKLSSEILTSDKSNVVANGVKLIYEQKDSQKIMENIPKIFSSDYSFKLIIAGELIRRKDIDSLQKLFELEITSAEFNPEISKENAPLIGTLSTIWVDRALRQTPNVLFRPIGTTYSRNSDLIKANVFLQKYLSFYKGSEKYNLLQTHHFLLHYSKYLLSGSQSEVQEMLDAYHLIDEKSKRIYVVDLACSLTQTGKAQKAVELIKQFDISKDIQMLSVLSSLYGFMSQKELAAENSEKVINQVEYFDEDNLSHLIHYFINLCESDTKKSKVFNELKEKGKFKDSIAEAIAECFSKIQNKNDHLAISQRLNEIYEETTGDQLHYKRDIAGALSMIGEYKRANEILKPIIDFHTESIYLKQYILNLYYSKEEHHALLSLLKEWRDKFSSDKELLGIEIPLLTQIPNWIELEKACLSGLQIDPNNPGLIYNYALSLAKQKKLVKARESLHSLLNLNIPDQFVFHFVGLANEIGDHESALELMYRAAIDPENKIARERYFSTYAFLSEFLKKPELTVAIEDTYGLFEIGEQKVKHEISRKNPIGSLFINAELETKIEYPKAFTEKIQQIKLAKIIDKYGSLFIDIRDEVSDNDFTGMNIQSFNFTTLEDFEQKLIEFSGAEGTKRKIFTEDILKKYLNNDIPFSNVVRQVFNDNAIDAYHYLTQSENFRVLRKSIFEKISFASSPSFVIDFTSLILFESLSHDLDTIFTTKFIISNFIVEYVESELNKTIISPPKEISLNITHERVVPYFFDENHKNNRIEYLKRLLSWINKYCYTKEAPEKLDILRKLDEKIISDEPYFQYILDTAMLASIANSVLITDDSIFMKLLFSSGHMVNSETYLSRTFIDQYSISLIPFLLNKNYLGISIYGKNLKAEFDKTFGLENSTYNKCLKNLNPLIGSTAYSMQGIIDFIKYVYLKPLLPEHKRRISQEVLSAWLIGMNNPLLRTVYEPIKMYIHFTFRLLPQYEKSALDDFEAAIKTTRHEANIRKS